MLFEPASDVSLRSEDGEIVGRVDIRDRHVGYCDVQDRICLRLAMSIGALSTRTYRGRRHHGTGLGTPLPKQTRRPRLFRCWSSAASYGH